MEKFIKQNRQAFDTELPSQRVWAGIENELHESASQPKMIELRLVYRIAASVALILTFGVLLGYYIGSNSTNREMAAKLADVERYYQSQMDTKMSELAAYQADDIVAEDLATLESRYTSLVSEDVYSEDQYMHAVIENFEARLAIMEKVLDRMKQYSNKGKREKNENVNIEI